MTRYCWPQKVIFATIRYKNKCNRFFDKNNSVNLKGKKKNIFGGGALLLRKETSAVLSVFENTEISRILTKKLLAKIILHSNINVTIPTG